MKRLIILILFISILVLSGCGGPPSAGPQPLLETPQKARDAVQLENRRTQDIQQSTSETTR